MAMLDVEINTCGENDSDSYLSRKRLKTSALFDPNPTRGWMFEFNKTDDRESMLLKFGDSGYPEALVGDLDTLRSMIWDNKKANRSDDPKLPWDVEIICVFGRLVGVVTELNVSYRRKEAGKVIVHVEMYFQVRNVFLAEVSKEYVQKGIGLMHCGRPMEHIEENIFGCWNCGVTKKCKTTEVVVPDTLPEEG